MMKGYLTVFLSLSLSILSGVIFYVDLSYQEAQPSLQNMERRLQYYLSENIVLFQNSDLWGNLALKNVVVNDVQTAADGYGGSMKNQAVQYI